MLLTVSAKTYNLLMDWRKSADRVKSFPHISNGQTIILINYFITGAKIIL
jgi:hypothetical protein